MNVYILMYHLLYFLVIQRQGDQRKNVATCLVQVNYMDTNLQIGRVLFVVLFLCLMTCYG
jgi:hypothetical protein